MNRQQDTPALDLDMHLCVSTCDRQGDLILFCDPITISEGVQEPSRLKQKKHEQIKGESLSSASRESGRGRGKGRGEELWQQLPLWKRDRKKGLRLEAKGEVKEWVGLVS